MSRDKINRMNALQQLLSPRSVAIVGASSDVTKTAGKPVHFLKKHGYAGNIYPVNPRVDSIDGLKCYASVKDLPEAPEVGLVLLGASRAHVAIRELAEAGATAAIVLASGYSEVGPDGERRQAELLEAAGSMRILGPNTIGLVNLSERILLSASGALAMESFPVGHIGIVSQSGGILGSLLSRAAGRGIGLSKLISTSNEADLELSDFIDYLVDDPETKVLALYIEAIRKPENFRRAAYKAAQAGKPVVAYKIGRSEAGVRAAVSHTGAMAGSDAMYDALFRECGVLRARTFDDLLDLPLALAGGRMPAGNRIAVLTSTGGAATLVSDSLGEHGFEMPPPDEETAEKLRAVQPGDHTVFDRNPIDVTLAGLQPEVLRKVVQLLLDSPSYDALVIIVGSSGVGAPDLMANAIAPCLETTAKPVIAYVSPHAPEATALLTARNVPAYASPESCGAVFAAMLRFASRRPMAQPLGNVPTARPQHLPCGVLDEAQSKLLFSAFGIACTREQIVESPHEAQMAAKTLGGKVALKILSSKITHKSDVGGVALGLEVHEVASAMEVMRSRVEAATGAAPQRFLVQQMAPHGIEMILGLKADSLGKAILLGAGGAGVELFGDTALCFLPLVGGLGKEQALALVRSLRIWPMLNGYRGRPKADVAALTDAVVAFSNMIASLGDEMIEAEINPLFVLPEGEGVLAADGIVSIDGAR